MCICVIFFSSQPKKQNNKKHWKHVLQQCQMQTYIFIYCTAQNDKVYSICIAVQQNEVLLKLFILFLISA